MSVDLSQFHQVFVEESFEGLDAMESALMALDVDQPDMELINTVFRAAHSIKGGAATFGFCALAEFTHILETLLDQWRSGKRAIFAGDVDLLLQSVDCMRELLRHLQNKNNQPTDRSQYLKCEFEAVLAQSGMSSPIASHQAASRCVMQKTWAIRFVPGPDIVKTGNDPLRIFSALEELGDLSVSAQLSGVPCFAELDAECLYLSWDLVLESDASEAVIREQFEWVIDDCELAIKELSSPENCAASTATATEQSAEKKEKAQTLVSKPVTAEASSIRVGIDKIDSLINMVGELVIIQSMLGEIGSDFNLNKLPKLVEGLEHLEQNTRELQESVMRIRMLPISFNFSRFPRMVRDLAQQLNKKVHLEMHGEHTELDKTVMEKIGDPLVHLVRNAVDHGIETPEQRLAAGKPETGQLTLNAYHQGGNVVIEIIDDGKGLDRERIVQKAQDKGLIEKADATLLNDEQVYDLIFQPGFSTAETVSEVSGRGVGMDVVRRNIQALKGSVEISSEKAKGSTIRIRLPLTLAIMDGQLVRVGHHTYIFPLTSIVESMRCRREQLNHVAGGGKVFRLRDEYVPVLALSDIFQVHSQHDDIDQSLMVVVESEGGKLGVVVDELLAQQQVVIKTLEQNYRKVDGISGATILGDGTVALIIDIPGIVELALAIADNKVSAQRQQNRPEPLKLKRA